MLAQGPLERDLPQRVEVDDRAGHDGRGEKPPLARPTTAAASERGLALRSASTQCLSAQRVRSCQTARHGPNEHNPRFLPAGLRVLQPYSTNSPVPAAQEGPCNGMLRPYRLNTVVVVQARLQPLECVLGGANLAEQLLSRHGALYLAQSLELRLVQVVDDYGDEQVYHHEGADYHEADEVTATPAGASPSR